MGDSILVFFKKIKVQRYFNIIFGVYLIWNAET